MERKWVTCSSLDSVQVLVTVLDQGASVPPVKVGIPPAAALHPNHLMLSLVQLAPCQPSACLWAWWAWVSTGQGPPASL